MEWSLAINSKVFRYMQKLNRTMLNKNDKKGKVPFLKIWLGFFAYAGFIALIIQFIVLPYIFPSWHAGNGLLKQLDCVWFHELAVELAQKIHTQGWSAWVLLPGGQAPAGIAGAIYAISVPKLWTTIPLNAALHATAALVLFKILLIFISRWRIAILFVLPFLMYPSAVTWYSQNHKDGYSIAGTILFVYGWILLARMDTWQRNWRQLCTAILLIISGIVLSWIVRPYLVEILQGAGALLAMVVTVTCMVWVMRHHFPWLRAILSILLVWTIVYAIKPPIFSGARMFSAPMIKDKELRRTIKEFKTDDKKLRQMIKEFKTDDKKFKTDDKKLRQMIKEFKTDDKELRQMIKEFKTDDKELRQMIKEFKTGREEVKRKTIDTLPEYLPYPITWVAKFIESRLYYLAKYRAIYCIAHPNAKSYIDPHVKLRNMGDYLSYMPRAAQIAFLSPFPNMWLEQGSSGQTTLMRKISAFEMIIVYFSLLGTPLAIWCFYRRSEFWVALLFCSSMLLFFGFAIPNAGTLYRMRYGYLMIVVAIGLMGFYAFWQELQKKRQSTHPMHSAVDSNKI